MIVAALIVDPLDGAVSMGEQSRVFRGMDLKSVRMNLGPFISNETTWGTYHRLECHLGEDKDHLTFGGWRAEVISTLQDETLVGLSWRLWPNKGKAWPLEGETDYEQMRVLRTTLRAQLDRSFTERFEQFEWGSVGCLPDLHTNDPSVRLQYRTAA